MKAAADLSGRWAATFTMEDGSSYEAVGEFTQQGNAITGTFLTPTGDHRFLAGEVSGSELRLSTFDGGHGFLYHAAIGPDGGLRGTLWSGLGAPVTFVATRSESASLGAAERRTAMREGAQSLDFRFPDLDGTPVSLRDPRFAGKVVVIALAGSWCPNCHDEAAFLAPWYRENRQRGVEVISLMFEQFGDLPQAVASTRRFRDHYGIDYATLIAGVSDKDDAARKLPQLNGVFAFPTTIFVDRKGHVRRIHTGFSGPATGRHYDELVSGFNATVAQLLSET
jgi:peroxiredoxin